MAISLNKLIQINNGTVGAVTKNMSLAGLLLSTNPLIPNNSTQRMIAFTTADQVGDYFGTNSIEYRFAIKYFQGADGQITVAPFMWVGRYIDADIAAYIRSGSVTNTALDAIKLVTAGTISFKFNGLTQTLSALDFSGANSLSSVALILQTALATSLTGATVVYNSQTEAFVATAPVATGNSTVDFCTTSSLATLLKFTSETNAILSQGAITQTPTENINNLLKISRNWATFTTAWDNGITSPYTLALELATITNANKNGANEFVFMCWTTNQNMITNIPGNLNTAIAVSRTSNIYVSYSDIDLIAGIMGAGAAVDYTLQGSTISYSNKSFSGVIPLVDDDASFDILTIQNINFYGSFASRAQTFDFTETGSVKGDWLYLENVLNNIWLSDDEQISVAAFFKGSGKNPYNIAGYENLKSVITQTLQLAVKNGTAEKGNEFTAAQRSELIQEAGFDITSTLTSTGFFIQVVQATPQERINRAPIISNVWYTNGGSWFKVKLNNRFVI